MSDYGEITFQYAFNAAQSEYPDIDEDTIKLAMMESANKGKEDNDKFSQEEYFALKPNDNPNLGSMRGFATFALNDIREYIDNLSPNSIRTLTSKLEKISLEVVNYSINLARVMKDPKHDDEEEERVFDQLQEAFCKKRQVKKDLMKAMSL